MTEQDMIIQDLRRENENLRAELEWKQKEIELARRHARQWISVEDRLPSAEVDVLVLTRSKSGSVNVDKGYFYFAAGLGRFMHRGRAEVSHWMPLPEPPKEVEE